MCLIYLNALVYNVWTPVLILLVHFNRFYIILPCPTTILLFFPLCEIKGTFFFPLQTSPKFGTSSFSGSHKCDRRQLSLLSIHGKLQLEENTGTKLLQSLSPFPQPFSPLHLPLVGLSQANPQMSKIFGKAKSQGRRKKNPSHSTLIRKL